MSKDSKKIAIIDYGAGNLGSVVNALKKFGYAPHDNRYRIRGT